jgi:hypothetical protein
MKLRIQGNTVRVRLNDKEVQSLADGHRLSDQTQFFSGSLQYIVQPAKSSEADFKQNTIFISVDELAISKWNKSDQVSISIESATSDAKKLSILVEKDMKV